MRISIPTSRLHSLARTALAHECNPDDARALALVKALEDPPALGPLLQMKALHGFDSACSNCGWRSVAGLYHGDIPPYLCETSP